MKKVFKKSCLLLSLLLVLTTILSACGKKPDTSTSSEPTTAAETKDPNAIDTSEEVKLTMYLVGDSYPDVPAVYDEINKMLKRDINATVEVKFTSWEMDKKIPLILASGEDFDCIYTGNWAQYVPSATKNAFCEITDDMLKKYMPDYYKDIPQGFIDSTKLNGKSYMIPYAMTQVYNYSNAIIRSDLREKYNLPELKTLDDFDNYMLTVAKNEKGVLPFDGNMANFYWDFPALYYAQPQNMFLGLERSLGLFSVKLDDPSGKVNYILDDPKYLDFLVRMKKLSDGGAWSKNIMSSQNTSDKSIKAGKSAVDVHHLGSMQGRTLDIQGINGAKSEVYDFSPDSLKSTTPGVQSGMAIHATSKNVERTLMMLNLFGTKQEYYDLLDCGIKGKHYELVGDKVKELPGADKAYPFDTVDPWGWQNPRLQRTVDGVPTIDKDWTEKWKSEGKVYSGPYIAFTFDDSKVKNEIAVCLNIVQTRGYALATGMLADPKAELEKYKAELKKAGIEKIQAELQQQLTAYINSGK